MAKGPSDIGEKNMALKQENMASNQKTSELNQKRVETSQKIRSSPFKGAGNTAQKL